MQFYSLIFSRPAAGVRQAGRRLIWLAWAAALAPVPASFGQPLAPGGLVATPVSTTQINLTWTDNSADEQGFQIEQSPDSITFSPIVVTTSNVTAYAVTNLNPAIRYYFRMLAFNGAGNSPYSNTNYASTRTPWAQWLLSKFTAQQLTNAAVSGPAADPDRDGLPNMVEYALNREPLSPDGTAPFAVGIEPILPDNFLTLTYTCNVAAIDVEFTAAVSSNLAAWFSGTNVVTGPIPVATNANTVTEKFRANTPLASAPYQFMQYDITYTGVHNSWETGAVCPNALQEVSCGVIGNKLYLVGGSYPPTLAYNIPSNTWTDVNSVRPFQGDHHMAEVYGGRWYLIGGLNGNVDGQVQIYDPVTNGWSLGAPMPFAAGTCASALIGGKIYVAGGILESNGLPARGTPTNAAAMYDPVSDAWTMIAPMPVGRNHTASGTDGFEAVRVWRARRQRLRGQWLRHGGNLRSGQQYLGVQHRPGIHAGAVAAGARRNGQGGLL